MSLTELLGCAEKAGPWLGYVVLLYWFLEFAFGGPETRALDRAIGRFDKRMEQLIDVIKAVVEGKATSRS